MKHLVLVLLFSFLATFVVSFSIHSNKRNNNPSPHKSTRLSSTRQPWEFGRFLQQSSKFISLPFLPSKDGTTVVVNPGDVLWQPNQKNLFSFGPLDDVVMGGVSSSNFNDRDGLWKGTVTDANNGGFIGIRSFPSFQLDMRACRGLEFKLRRGNGGRFKIITRDSTEFNGITWATSVDVGAGLLRLPVAVFGQQDNNDDTTTTVKVPLEKQVPTLFAKTVPGKLFDKRNVCGVQIAYSKFEYDGALNPKFKVGEVELQILEIKAY